MTSPSKASTALTILTAAAFGPSWCGAQEQSTGNMVKMCLFYDSPSGHARTDPIISQTCASDHMHTFYGPQNFHPDTSYEDIRDTSPGFSSSPWVENQSLYWHPSIYRRPRSTDGTQPYTRVSDLFSSPYYRWDNSVMPLTEAFPPKFRMIAYSDQEGADMGGETGSNFFMECCNDRDECDTWTDQVRFPQKNCNALGMSLAMPTCWNGDLGIDDDHKSHVAFTVDGTVAGACPEGFDRRLPQVQMFVRVTDYKGVDYEHTLADENVAFHVDFMNGWEEGKLQEIIDGCEVLENDNTFNPPCNCDNFLTYNFQIAGALCDEDVRKLILDEPTDTVSELPRGGCQGNIIPKIWSGDPPIECDAGGDEDDDLDVEPEDDDGGTVCYDLSKKKCKKNDICAYGKNKINHACVPKKTKDCSSHSNNEDKCNKNAFCEYIPDDDTCVHRCDEVGSKGDCKKIRKRVSEGPKICKWTGEANPCKKCQPRWCSE